MLERFSREFCLILAEKRSHSAAPRSAKVWSYREEKQAVLLTTITGRSNIQERREEEVKTKHWCIQSSDLILSSSCCWKWRIPTVESSKSLEAWSLHCGVGVGGVCWGLKFMNTRKIWLITSKFEKYWLGQSDLQSCLAMWRIEHHCSKMFFLVKRSGG